MSETSFSTPSDLEFEVSRTFDAPPELVFDVWTTCEHLPKWSGPEGWSLAACEVDLRPSGVFRYVWRRVRRAERRHLPRCRAPDPPRHEG